MTLKKKMILSFSLISFIALSTMMMFIYLQVNRTLSQELEQELEKVTDGIYNMGKLSYEINQDRIKKNLNVANFLLNNQVSLDKENTIDFQAIHQISKSVKSMNIPSMKLGDTTLSKNHAFVDKLTKMIGGTVTVFQVIPQGLLRISTSVKKLNGSRAVGTYIPKTSPVYKTVMQGKTFLGRAFVVTDWFISAYKPIYEKGKIIGVIYVGIKQTNLKSFREKVQKIKIGKSGYAYVMDSKGKLIIHPFLEGKNVFNSKDANGRHFIQKMIEKKNGKIIYPWKNKEKELRDKVVFFNYLKEMDWVIAAGSYIDEFKSVIYSIRNIFIFTVILGTLLLMLNSLWISNVVQKALKKFKKVFSSGVKGDLTQTYPIKNFDREKIISLPQDTENEDRDANIPCYTDIGSYAIHTHKKNTCAFMNNNTVKHCQNCKVYKTVAQDELKELGIEYNALVLSLQQKIAFLKKKISEILSTSELLAHDSQQSASSLQEVNASILSSHP